MSTIITASWKITVMTLLFIMINTVAGMLMPLSSDMFSAMTPGDRAVYFPLFILNVFLNMVVMYTVLVTMGYSGGRLVFCAGLSFIGLFAVVNATELYWYKESFPLFTYADITKMIFFAVCAYSFVSFVGTLLTGGFRRKVRESAGQFTAGPMGWKIAVFCLIYPLFYGCCGFIPWSFPAVREFYAGWNQSRESHLFLYQFNIFRGALWFLFSLPVLKGVDSRKQALWLMPLILVTGTAGAMITPSAVMPGIVRFAHSLELAFSMGVIGVFMALFFVKKRE